MASQKLLYANKQAGDRWTDRNVNEIKEVVNSHADDIDGLTDAVTAAGQTVQGMASSVSTLNNQVSQHATAINGITSRVSNIEADHSASYHDSSPAIVGPKTLHVWEEPLGSLTVLLSDNYSDASLEYRLKFTVATDLESPFTLTMRDSGNINRDVTPVWVGGDEPEWEEGYTYEISMMGLLAVAAGWAPAES